MKIKNIKIILAALVLVATLLVTSCSKESQDDPLTEQKSLPVTISFSEGSDQAFQEYENIIQDYIQNNPTEYTIPTLINDQLVRASNNNLIPDLKLVSFEPYAIIEDAASKQKIISLVNNDKAIIGAGSALIGDQIVFKSLVEKRKEQGNDFQTFLNESIQTGDYVLQLTFKIGEKEITSLALANSKGIYWDNISYLIDIEGKKSQENHLIENDNNVERAADCQTWGITRDLGYNVFGGAVGTAFVTYEVCWDCNRNINERSRIVNLYCTSLPLTNCVAGFAWKSGWGTTFIKSGFSADYDAPGVSLAVMGFGLTASTGQGAVWYQENVTNAGAAYTCPSCRTTSGDIDVALRANISLFIAKDLKGFGSHIARLYINHQNELSEIFASDQAIYKNVQIAFDDFWSISKGIVTSGFKNSGSSTITTAHINAADKVLVELAKVVKSKDLISAISVLSKQINVMEGKELKQGLKQLDQIKIDESK